MTDIPRMYGDLAGWWPLISAPEDYEEEAGRYRGLLRATCSGPSRTLLELGSGGGNNASHLARSFEHVTLVDLSPGMLDVSRALNPGCEHHLGDMRSVRLGRTFDCVFVHDAASYMTTPSDVARLVQTVWIHCRPGGSALLAPDFVRENFREETSHGGHDGAGRSVRYLEWSRDPDPGDTTYLVEYAYLLSESGDEVRVVHDRHVEGLFSKDDWLSALGDVGFVARAKSHRLSDVDRECIVFVGVRPDGT